MCNSSNSVLDQDNTGLIVFFLAIYNILGLKIGFVDRICRQTHVKKKKKNSLVPNR